MRNILRLPLDMRSFLRLSPVLRVASILRLLCILAALGLFITQVTGTDTDWGMRATAVMLNLAWISSACYVAVIAYDARWPDRGPFAFGSWHGQVRLLALLSALPLCGIAVALLLPLTWPAFWVVDGFAITGFLVVAAAWALAGGPASSGPMRTPPTG
jgi:hypothetical protein